MRLCPTLILTCLLLGAVSPAGAMPIVGVESGIAGFVGTATQGPFDKATLVSNYSSFVAVFGASTAGLSNPHLPGSVAAYFANGGQSLYVVRAQDSSDAALIGVDGGVPGTRTGLAALLDVDEISQVAIPGSSSASVHAAMIAHCEGAADRMAILDPAPTDGVTSVLARRALVGSSDGFAAFYFPWIQAAPAGVSTLLPPSGFVCGLYASNEPSNSPFGPVLTATGVAYTITTAEQDLLNTNQVNAIRLFSAQGVQVWGSRTLSLANEWRYVAVRRVGIYLEESIQEGTAWAVDVANDATLWSQLRADVESFLFSHFQLGWFAGATSNEAFFVRCDATTMTQLDLDEGRTILIFGFAPLRPAEFTLITVTQQRETSTAVAGLLAPARLLAPQPNPFNPSTEIRFILETPETVSLAVYDLAGRKVATLWNEQATAAGEHRALWSGRDRANRAVASGVYVVELRSASHRESRRIVLVK